MSAHSTLRFTSVAVVLLAVAMVTAADHAAAQSTLSYTNTTFLHGLASDSTIWTAQYPALGVRTPPQYLSQQVDLKVVRIPRLNVGAASTRGLRYAGQRDNLTQLVTSAGGQHVLVGHSLGSLVARGTYGVAGVGSQRVSGIVAIAAPHQGTRIADSAKYAVLYLRDLERTIKDAQKNAKIVGTVLSMVGFVTQQGFLILVGDKFLDGSAQNVDFPTDGVDAIAEAEALQDIRPTAAVIQSLNGYRSDGVIPRVNIKGSIPHGHALLRLASALPGAGSFESLKARKDEGLSSLRKCRNLGNFTFNLTDPGNKCRRAARMLGSLDERWVGWVNGTQYGLKYRIAGLEFWGQVPRKVPFDGAVANERSVYPTSNALTYETTVSGASHLDIYSRSEGLTAVANGMKAMGMRLSTPLTASISGPTSFESAGTLTWRASASGGNGAYTYKWSYRLDGSSQWYTFGGTGSSASLGVSASTPSFAVRVTVSSQGQTTTPSIYVTNTAEACVPPPGQSECLDQ